MNKIGKNCIADEIKFHLDMHYSDKLKLKEVARKFGVHPNYLTRIFREKYDIAPKQYLLHLKLEKACQLLRSTDLRVATIAGSMGFDDAMAFSKLFKKLTAAPLPIFDAPKQPLCKSL